MAKDEEVNNKVEVGAGQKPEELVDTPESLKANTDERLAKQYGEFGINLDVSPDIVSKVLSARERIANGQASPELMDMLKQDNKEAFVRAEALLDLMEVDEALKYIVDQRAKIAATEDSLADNRERLKNKEFSYQSAANELAEAEAAQGQLLLKTSEYNKFPEKDFAVNQFAVEYERRVRSGENPTITGQFTPVERTAAKAYLDRCDRDMDFKMAVSAREGMAESAVRIDGTKSRINDLRTEKAQLRAAIEQGETELLDQYRVLSGLISAAEMARQQLDDELANANNAELTGREVEIALSTTQDLGVPHLYKIVGITGGEAVLTRFDVAKKDPEKGSFGISGKIDVADLKKRGRLAKSLVS